MCIPPRSAASSLLLASDVLFQEHSSELGKRIRLRVVENSKDRLLSPGS